MQPSTRWFGWIALIAPLHMSEQLLFGIGELATLKRILAKKHGLHTRTIGRYLSPKK